jgi:hypothetical protein
MIIAVSACLVSAVFVAMSQAKKEKNAYKKMYEAEVSKKAPQ